MIRLRRRPAHNGELDSTSVDLMIRSSTEISVPPVPRFGDHPLYFHLCLDLDGKSFRDGSFEQLGRRAACAGGTDIARAHAAAQAAGRVDRQWQPKRVQAMDAIGGDQALVERVQGQRVARIAAGGFLQRGKVFLAAASNTVELLGLGVIRLEVRIGNRPVPDRRGMRLP